MKNILNTQELPFCKGCGHDLIAKSTAAALEKSGCSPLDIILVTDIGCHGIIDTSFNTHTIHGLHGRSVSLGVGISLGLNNSDKKVIVFTGDGGATIGLQHIMEAARLNINMTIVIHNNMLYGMTGGQTSGLTPQGFNTTTAPSGNTFEQYDICGLAHTAGASYISRILGIGNIADKLAEAINTNGCSVVEVIELCPGYGMKLNPKRKLAEILESSGKSEGIWTNNRLPFAVDIKEEPTSLLKNLKAIEIIDKPQLKSSYTVLLSGSAGEGVQTAANILAITAVSSGYHVTQKGSYPVTVGVGFSTAEIIISPNEILYHGMTIPDIAIITSQDGLNHSKKRINLMNNGILMIDSSLSAPQTGARVYNIDFRSIGVKSASMFSLFYFSEISKILPHAAIFKAIEQHGDAHKIPLDKIKEIFRFDVL
ncbi:MAG: 2-oxoacid:acceptor oxidoreductase family protein [Bacteroidia bacterium]|nr:2-oxoacid:acceptor oxidoreductase family protein [Bacteroidia bacterium]